MTYILIGLGVIFVLGVFPNLLIYGTDVDCWENIVGMAFCLLFTLGLCGAVLYIVGLVATLFIHILF